MGNCGGKSTYESTIDDFFLLMKLVFINNEEVNNIII